MKTPQLKRGPKWLQAYLNSLREDCATAQPVAGANVTIKAEIGKGTIINATPKPAKA